MDLLPAFVGAPQENNVYNVDALTLLKALPTGSVDLIVTSPPYDSLRKYNGYSFDFEAIAHESYRVLKQCGVLVWVVGDAFVNGSETLTGFRQALHFKDVVGFRMHQRIIWQKEGMPTKRPKAYLPDFEDVFVLSKGEPATFNPVMRRNKNAGTVLPKVRSNVDGKEHDPGFRVVADSSLLTNVQLVRVGNANDDDRTGHPAVYPEALAERHILTWSNPGDLVLDYFGGSGTTAKMARNNNRRWLTCDISADYCEIIRKRMSAPWTLPMFAA